LIALAGVAAFAGAAVQSASGFGLALVLSPALFAVMDQEEAVAALLLLAAAVCILVLVESRRVATHGLVRLIVPALPGLPLGLFALAALSKELLQVGVGLAVIAAALWQARHAAVSRFPAAVAGFLSGVLTTSISINGPPLALWLEAEGVPPAAFRATLAAAFLFLDIAGGALLLSREGLDTIDAGVLGPLLACVAAGYAVGALGFRRLDTARFFRFVLVLLLCTGLASVLAGVT
jgi:uncharacterized protein